MRILRTLSRTESGASMIEYALMVALISVVAITGITMVGGATEKTFLSVGDSLVSAPDQSGGTYPGGGSSQPKSPTDPDAPGNPGGPGDGSGSGNPGGPGDGSGGGDGNPGGPGDGSGGGDGNGGDGNGGGNPGDGSGGGNGGGNPGDGSGGGDGTGPGNGSGGGDGTGPGNGDESDKGYDGAFKYQAADSRFDFEVPTTSATIQTWGSGGRWTPTFNFDHDYADGNKGVYFQVVYINSDGSETIASNHQHWLSASQAKDYSWGSLPNFAIVNGQIQGVIAVELRFTSVEITRNGAGNLTDPVPPGHSVRVYAPGIG